MFATGAFELLQPERAFELYLPFVIIAAIVILAVGWYMREGRHAALEQIVAHRDFGSPTNFEGTLAVEEYRPQNYLRLNQGDVNSRFRKFWYRWVVGIGPQAAFDEVIFDASRQQVILRKKDKQTALAFSEVRAIRMREKSAGNLRSMWHLQLVTQNNKVLPFATSAVDDRRRAFERSAAVAKAASLIASAPVHVFVAGNIWTQGWPPKKRATAA